MVTSFSCYNSFFCYSYLVHGRGQRHLYGGHAVHVETEYLGAGEPHHEAQHLLLVWGEAARLDGEGVVTWGVEVGG